MQNYEEVPTIISCDDLHWLCDIYNWNFNACKLVNHFLKEVEDEDIKLIFKKISDTHKQHAIAILNILR